MEYLFQLEHQTIQFPMYIDKVLFVAANLEKESKKCQQSSKYLEFLKNLGTRYGIPFTDIAQIINEYKEFHNT